MSELASVPVADSLPNTQGSEHRAPTDWMRHALPRDGGAHDLPAFVAQVDAEIEPFSRRIDAEIIHHDSQAVFRMVQTLCRAAVLLYRRHQWTCPDSQTWLMGMDYAASLVRLSGHCKSLPVQEVPHLAITTLGVTAASDEAAYCAFHPSLFDDLWSTCVDTQRETLRIFWHELSHAALIDRVGRTSWLKVQHTADPMEALTFVMCNEYFANRWGHVPGVSIGADAARLRGMLLGWRNVPPSMARTEFANAMGCLLGTLAAGGLRLDQEDAGLMQDIKRAGLWTAWVQAGIGLSVLDADWWTGVPTMNCGPLRTAARLLARYQA